MNKLLITAFGPFPGVESNPSALLLERFDAKRRIPLGWTFSTAFLPVSYAYCKTWTRHVLRKERYEAVLHLGVALGADGFRLEQYAHNRCDKQSKDVDGLCWQKDKIDSRAPQLIPSSLPVDEIVAALKKRDLPLSVSEDAGGYLCNFIFFESLRNARTYAPGRKVGFLHIPRLRDASSDTAGIPLDTHMRVLEAVVVEITRRPKTAPEESRHR